MIPVFAQFNFDRNPLGKVAVKASSLFVEFAPYARVSSYELETGRVAIVPAYKITEEENGIVKKVEITHFSVSRRDQHVA